MAQQLPETKPPVAGGFSSSEERLLDTLCGDLDVDCLEAILADSLPPPSKLRKISGAQTNSCCAVAGSSSEQMCASRNRKSAGSANQNEVQSTGCSSPVDRTRKGGSCKQAVSAALRSDSRRSCGVSCRCQQCP